MNKILVRKNELSCENSDIAIKDNIITINKNMDISLEYVDCSSICLIFNILSEIRVNLVIFSNNKKIDVNNIYNLNSGAYLNISKFYNNLDTTEKEVINLNGNDATIDYRFSTICVQSEKYNLIVNHNMSHTISNIINKSITVDDASTIFNIDSNLAKDMGACVLNQDSRIVLLGSNNSQINPNMYILNNDVIAKHSSVIGTFNESELFYLMTRGINYHDSLKLLIKGFILSNLKVNMDIRERILKIINDYWR